MTTYRITSRTSGLGIQTQTGTTIHTFSASVHCNLASPCGTTGNIGTMPRSLPKSRTAISEPCAWTTSSGQGSRTDALRPVPPPRLLARGLFG
jgi:hypothetical protein